MFSDFEYDGAGPDAFFWVGTEGEPSTVGTILPYPFKGQFYEYEDADAPILEGAFDKVCKEILGRVTVTSSRRDGAGLSSIRFRVRLAFAKRGESGYRKISRHDLRQGFLETSQMMPAICSTNCCDVT